MHYLKSFLEQNFFDNEKRGLSFRLIRFCTRLTIGSNMKLSFVLFSDSAEKSRGATG